MKHTLPIIEKTLKSYVDKLFQIDVETDSEFIAAVKKAKDELLADIVVLRDQNPELFYLNYKKTLGEDSAKEIIKKISKNAFSHYGLDTLPSTEFLLIRFKAILSSLLLLYPHGILHMWTWNYLRELFLKTCLIVSC